MMPTRLRISSVSLFQSLTGAMGELVDQDGRPPLGQEQQREARRRSARSPGRLRARNPSSRVLLANELLGTLAIPVVLAEEADAGEPAGPLQPVEVIVPPAWPLPKFWPTWKWLASQSSPTGELAVVTALAAVLDRLAVEDIRVLRSSSSR